MAGHAIKTSALRILVSVALIVSLAFPAYAQQPQDQPQVSSEWTSGPGIKKHVATIIYTGLAGFILGLSTLSFYGRPQDQLTNVTYGLAGGVVVGTVYVAYQAASNPKDFYAEPGQATTSQFELEQMKNGRFAQAPEAKALNFQFTF